MVVNLEKFPSGMKAIGDYIHSHGLKFGIYSSAGKFTCEGYSGSLDFEKIDAQDWASWGVDYIKYDNCFNEARPGLERYTAMRKAINETGREMVFSICIWGLEDVWEWGPKVGNSWRTTGDITPDWHSIEYIFKTNQLHADVAGPGHWNDPDMLEVGNGRLTFIE